MKYSIAKFKVIADRQRNYLSFFNFLMLSYLFFKEVGFTWYYLLAVPFWIAFAIFDIKMILPKELDYIWGKSSLIRKLVRDRENVK